MRLRLRTTTEQPTNEHTTTTMQDQDQHDAIGERDNSFGMRVIRKLAERGEWGAVHYAADNACGMSSLGPLALAKNMNRNRPGKVTADDVVEEVLRGYSDLLDDCESTGATVPYGPEADDDEEEESEEGGPYPTKPDDAEDDHFRRNGGGNYGAHYDEIPGHRIYAELDRLEQAGVTIMHHRIVETEDDVHPDYLEIHYGGVPAEEIEKHRYRHIDSTRDYGVASRPLSELPAHSQEVSG